MELNQKWHSVAEGDFPEFYKEVLVIYEILDCNDFMYDIGAYTPLDEKGKECFWERDIYDAMQQASVELRKVLPPEECYSEVLYWTELPEFPVIEEKEEK